jgi:putative phosphoribosyl transferase
VSAAQFLSTIATARIEPGCARGPLPRRSSAFARGGAHGAHRRRRLATGASLKAAARALATRAPARIIGAMPVAPAGARSRVGSAIDDLVCVHVPTPFFSVGQFYLDFDQIDDETVRDLLDRASGGADSAA